MSDKRRRRRKASDDSSGEEDEASITAVSFLTFFGLFLVFFWSFFGLFFRQIAKVKVITILITYSNFKIKRIKY